MIFLLPSANAMSGLARERIFEYFSACVIPVAILS